MLTINVLLKTLSFVNEAAFGAIVLRGTFRNIAKAKRTQGLRSAYETIFFQSYQVQVLVNTNLDLTSSS